MAGEGGEIEEGRQEGVQDLAKTPDHTTCTTPYTLRVDLASINRKIGGGIVQAILNLRLRLADEMRKQEQVCPAVCTALIPHSASFCPDR